MAALAAATPPAARPPGVGRRRLAHLASWVQLILRPARDPADVIHVNSLYNTQTTVVRVADYLCTPAAKTRSLENAGCLNADTNARQCFVSAAPPGARPRAWRVEGHAGAALRLADGSCCHRRRRRPSHPAACLPHALPRPQYGAAILGPAYQAAGAPTTALTGLPIQEPPLGSAGVSFTATLTARGLQCGRRYALYAVRPAANCPPTR